MESGAASYQAGNSRGQRHETLTVFEASRRAGVTQSAIIRWIRNGYLSATPSENGWLIPADQLDRAAESADEARGTTMVPRKVTPSLMPAPTPIRYSVERRSVALTQEAIGDQIVAPLAELIRDQIDVVHDQAEVIGWLQAERSRLHAELERLRLEDEASDIVVEQEASVPAPAPPAESELYDEVLSLLWKEDPGEEPAPPKAQEEFANGDGHSAEPEPMFDLWSSDRHFTPFEAEPEPEPQPQAEPAPVVEPAMMAEDEQEVEETPLTIEDYADPSWFFNHQHRVAEPARARPTLQPIVRRESGRRRRSSGGEDNSELHRMIDETERKIADLWRTQEELRRSSPQVIEQQQARASRETRWQRLWPLRR